MELVGLGRLEPNTVVLGYQTPELSRDPNDPPEVDQDDYVSVIRTSMNFGFNVVIAKNLEKMDFTKRRSGNIDIWWLSDDGGLTLLVAHLLSQHPLWRHCKLRAMVLSDASTMAAKIRKTKVRGLAAASRLQAARDTSHPRCVCVCVCVCVAVWLCGCVAVWLCGCVAVCRVWM